jgi:hypothetical protein
VIPFLADHCFDEDILRAVIRRNPSIDFVLARDEGLQEAEDPDILAWAVQEGRVVITLDRNTMIAFALERIRHRQPMAGLVVINQFAPLSRLIEHIILLGECTDIEEWHDRIEYVPL